MGVEAGVEFKSDKGVGSIASETGCAIRPERLFVVAEGVMEAEAEL